MKYITGLRTTILTTIIMTLSACGGGGGNSSGNGGGNQNQAPSASAGSDISVDEQTTVTLTGSGSDTDGTIASYSWQQSSGTTVELSNPNSATTDFTSPTLITAETLTFELTVTDNLGLSATDSMTVTVNPVNEAPTAQASDDIVARGLDEVTLNGSGTDSDGQIVSYSWSQTQGSSVTLTNADSQQATFTAPDVSTTEQFTFELTVTDNEGMSASDTTLVVVNPKNNPPSADAGEDFTVNEQQSVTLSGSGTDSDGTIDTYLWTQTSGTAVNLSNVAVANPSFTSPTLTQSEQLTFELTVTDNQGAIDVDSVIVTVVPVNAEPTVSAGDNQNIVKGTAVTLTASASDADGQITNYQWTQTGGTAVTLNDSDTASASFTAPNASTLLTFQLTVTDNEGATASDTIDINIIDSAQHFLVDSQIQANQYPPSTQLTWSVENYNSESHTLTWDVTSTAPLKYDTLGTSIDNPDTISFTTLLVAEDTEVTISATLNDGNTEFILSKTITMLAQGDVKFALRQQDNEQLANLLKSETIVMDITGDGFDDIISKDQIALGSASGELTIEPINSGIEATDFSVADINNDGLADIILTNEHQISWSLNSNNGDSFSQYEVINMAPNISSKSAQVGDFDGDGDIDLAQISIGSPQDFNDVRLVWNERENGRLKGDVVIASNLARGASGGTAILVAGNFRNNGKTDIIVAPITFGGIESNDLFVHTGSDNNGGFERTTAFHLPGGSAFSTYRTSNISTADLNQDGYDDVIISQGGISFNNDNALSYYFFNNQDGSFSGDNLHHSFDIDLGWSTTDIDGDGDLDIIHGNGDGDFYGDIGSSTANSFPGRLIWYENLGNSFSSEQKIIMYDSGSANASVGDFDNDGDIDIVNGQWYSENKLNEANNDNQAPSVSAGSDISVDEYTMVNLIGSASDADGSISAYYWTQLSGAGVILSTPTQDSTQFTAPLVTEVTTLTFELSVIDDKGLRATDTITVTVNPINTAPSALADNDLTVDEQTQVTLTGNGTDNDGYIAFYSWTQTSGTAANFESTSGQNFTFTAPAITTAETLTFELTVTDNEGATATDSVDVMVNPVNLAPTALAGDDKSVNEQTTVTLSGNGTDSDGSIASYLWTQSSGTSVALSNAGTANASFTTPTLTSIETLTFALTVTDNEGLIATDSVNVTVNPVNLSPTAMAGNNQSVDEQTAVTLNGSGTDSDGSIASYSWAQSSGTSVTLTNAGTASASFTAPTLTSTEALTFALTVTDNEGASHVDSLTITVNPVNLSPTAMAGNDQSVDEQTAVTLNGSGTDSDGSITSYSWAQSSGTSVTLTNADSASVSFEAPTVTSTEALTFALTVTDNEGATHADSVTVSVNPVNAAPTLFAGDDQTVASQDSVTLAGTASDSDGSIATISWSQTAGTSVILTDPSSLTTTFMAPQITTSETLTFTLSVTDNEGATSTDSININVTAPSTSIYTLVDSQQQASEYGPATLLKWSVNNYDSENHTLTWKITTDAQLAFDTAGLSTSNPDTIEFTTLLVATDTTVKIEVNLNDGSQDHLMSKTITMLAQGSVTFATVEYNTSHNLAYLASQMDSVVMDITADGFNDIITKEHLALGSATGQFTVQAISAGFTPTDFSVADINNDGLKDILLSNSNQISWLANSNDDSRFSQATALEAPANTAYIQARAADFDGDNDTDIVMVYEIGSDNIPQMAWLENQSGTFAALATIDAQINKHDHPDGYPMITIGNFNNNSKTDIIVASASTSSFRPNVLYAHGDSGFEKSNAYDLTGSDTNSSFSTRHVKTIDINQDGYDDILTWQSGTSNRSQMGTSYYLINNQDGTFTKSHLHFAYGFNFSAIAADVDNDGDMDIVHGNGDGFSYGLGSPNNPTFAGKLIWFENLGGTFSTETKMLLNSDNAYILHAGDLDNDGDIDVLNKHSTEDTVWFSENKLK